MKLTCPDCQKHVSAADVNIKLGIAKCLACDAVFSLVDQIGQPLRSLRNSLPATAPKHWMVEDFGSELTIRWRWYTHAIWFLVFFAIIWDGFLISWYTAAIAGLLIKFNWGSIIMLVFPVLHLAVGVGLTYLVLTSFLNRTVVRVSGGELSIYQGPLPVWGNRRLSIIDICQFFCTESSSRGKRGYSYTYSLNALLVSGERVCLLNNFQDASEPLYLERTLEERLKIADERVPGDWVG